MTTTAVVRFPRAMKRGAKVRRGPCAAVLSFPVQLSGEELDARHSWMMENRGKWATEATDGLEYHEPMVALLMQKAREKWPEKYPRLTMERMRRDIADGRKLIEKRNRVKAWMQSLGADLDAITTPDQALFFVFDRLQEQLLPTSA